MKALEIRLGMRTIKTALAVFLILLTYHFINRPAFAPALAAIFALRESWENSITFAKIRLVSNAVGGFSAMIFFLIRENTHNSPFIMITLMPFLVILTIIILDAINYNPGVISGLAALLLIALTIPTDATIHYVFLRIIDTFVGILFALAINRYHIPDVPDDPVLPQSQSGDHE
ncbi:aromatic acid exporter family protein [Leuconostocaceae bacterium ESL0958]|nr:aromatic acid exporter family protein [Leuconostocaceae bacterium ESL0958]